MKVAYLVFDIDENSGVYKKITEQARYWKDALDVDVVVINHKKISEFRRKNRKPFLRFLASRSSSALWNMLRKVSPDIIYARYTLALPDIIRVATKIPTVVEVNSDDILEYKHYSLPVRFFNRLTRGALLKKVAGLVFVTKELEHSRHFVNYSKKRVVIPNGIDLASFPVHEAPKNARPCLVFIGTPGLAWHGIDKIIQMASLFDEWDFKIIGMDAVAEMHPPNMQFYGYLKKDEYEKIMEGADVAIGSMALHRKGMHEACPLKVRECLAFGIPMIIAFQDSDFIPGENWFICDLENTETCIVDDKNKIAEFMLAVKGRRVNKMMLKNIDIGHKESTRIAFFESIIQESKAR